MVERKEEAGVSWLSGHSLGIAHLCREEHLRLYALWGGIKGDQVPGDWEKPHPVRFSHAGDLSETSRPLSPVERETICN